ncbi:MAG: hypothetical protein IH987_19780 [Planctomycetes bacterium]|nr:hypothetical protein [Planctomycetota bacterium]
MTPSLFQVWATPNATMAMLATARRPTWVGRARTGCVRTATKCCPAGCDPGNDDACAVGGCVNPGGLPVGSPYVNDIDCCNDKCKGPQGGKTCT